DAPLAPPPPPARPHGGRGRSPRGPGPVVSASLVVPSRSALADYVELTKPRITLTVVMTSLVGYVMGSRGPISLPGLALALAGVALVGAGASALNMLLE